MKTTSLFFASLAIACAAPSPLPADGADSSESGDATAAAEPTSTGTSTSTTTSESTQSGESTGGVDGCGGEDFLNAPPTVSIDGIDVVPIDVSSSRAAVVLDAVALTATVSAAITFRVSPDGGYPAFDLDQEVDTVFLDGEELPVDAVDHADLQEGAGSLRRVIARELEPCTEHTLEVGYALPSDSGLSWWYGEIWWSFGSYDFEPYASHLEFWFPSNMMFDLHSFELDLEIRGEIVPHELLSNGEVTAISHQAWHVEFPETSTALSPGIFLLPHEYVGRATEHVVTPTQTIEVDCFGLYYADDCPTIAAALQEFTASTGPFAHERMTVIIAGHAYSVYDGAVIQEGPSYLEHAVLKSWFGHGVRPRAGRDGWIGEAWAEWSTIDPKFPVASIDSTRAPIVLAPDSPWIRGTAPEAWDEGREVFAALAEIRGSGALRDAMADFYIANVPGIVSTEDLERHLFCALGDPLVLQLFHRFVYGRRSEPGAPPEC